jgi:hypothetical protein
MATVTICIPAYEVGSFLGETLRSVQSQTYTDFTVEVAIEPPHEAAIKVVKPFLTDSRFRYWINETRLGWDANIAAQLTRVGAPYFMILPHDDIVEQDYVSTLLTRLRARPDASVAYADMSFFGVRSGTKSLPLPPNGRPEERVLAFFLAGAQAVPWRGVTRASVIGATSGFPTDGHGGFAVECEWALSLLLLGHAIHEPRPLYKKRLHAPSIVSASRARIGRRSHEQLIAAMERHRTHMLEPLGRLCSDTPTGRLLFFAAKAAMLQRHVTMVGALTPDRLGEATHLLSELDPLLASEPRAASVRSMVAGALSRHARLVAPKADVGSEAVSSG